MDRYSFMLLHLLAKEKMHKKIHYFTLTLGSRSKECCQCPLHNVTYAPTKFEVTMSKGLGGDAFTRKYIF